MLKYSDAMKLVLTRLEDAVASRPLLQNWHMRPSGCWDSADAHMDPSLGTILG